MTTLITGATGHLGANLSRELIKRGEKLRLLLRRNSGNKEVKGLDAEFVYGDLKDFTSLKMAVAGCQRVYHLGAFVSIRNDDREELFDVNVLGTRRLMKACRMAGVERVVHCSSFGAIGNNPNGSSTEKWSVSPFEETTDYELSKTFAEWEVYKEIGRGLNAVIVNPSGIVGPWDFKPSLLGNTILEFARGKMKAYIGGAFDFVAARDVVEGMILAMEKGKKGERYILTGENLTIFQTLEWLEELTGKKRPKIKMPTVLIQNVAIVKDWVERKFFPDVMPRFNYHSIRLLQSGKYGDNSKSVDVLGLKPTSVKEAYREAVNWFKEYGYV